MIDAGVAVIKALIRRIHCPTDDGGEQLVKAQLNRFK